MAYPAAGGFLGGQRRPAGLARPFRPDAVRSRRAAPPGASIAASRSTIMSSRLITSLMRTLTLSSWIRTRPRGPAGQMPGRGRDGGRSSGAGLCAGRLRRPRSPLPAPRAASSITSWRTRFRSAPMLHQDLGGHALALAHQAEQDVLGADVVVAELQCLAERELEHLFGPRGERDMGGLLALARPDDLPDLAADRVQADPHRRQGPRRHAIALRGAGRARCARCRCSCGPAPGLPPGPGPRPGAPGR